MLALSFTSLFCVTSRKHTTLYPIISRNLFTMSKSLLKIATMSTTVSPRLSRRRFARVTVWMQLPLHPTCLACNARPLCANQSSILCKTDGRNARRQKAPYVASLMPSQLCRRVLLPQKRWIWMHFEQRQRSSKQRRLPRSKRLKPYAEINRHESFVRELMLARHTATRSKRRRCS